MATTLTTSTTPRAWIGCLACYNEGLLVGDWYDAVTADEVTPEGIHNGPTSHDELWLRSREHPRQGRDEP